MSPSLSLLPLLLWATTTQTEIATTDQAPYAAQVLSISTAGVVVEADNKQSVVPLDKLRRLSFSKPPASQRSSASSNAAQQVTVRDGSQFRYQTFDLAAGKASFSLEGGAMLTLPTAAVQHVQLQQLTPAQWTQWQAIVQSRSTADTLVLIRSADALEKLEGIVSTVSAAAVSFDFGGQVIDAPLTKLAGMCLFSAPASGGARGKESDMAGEKLSAIVHDVNGNRWMASTISLPPQGRQVELQLVAGAAVSLPLEQLAEIDFSSGSTQYLADLQPLARSSGSDTAGVDNSAGGSLPLGLSVAGADNLFGPRSRNVRALGKVSLGPSLEFVGGGSISYRIPEGFTRLRGEVELTPTGNRFTPCQASVLLENKLIWQERLSETGRRWTVDVPVVADGRLRIEVASEAQTAVGDIVLWHELRLVK